MCEILGKTERRQDLNKCWVYRLEFLFHLGLPKGILKAHPGGRKKKFEVLKHTLRA